MTPADLGRRLPVDSRIIQEIQGSPTMSAENPSLMAQYGGAEAYQYWARQPLEDRLVFYATQEGYSSPKAIAEVTDLKESTVNRTIGKLMEQGFLTVGEVTPEA